MAAQSSLGQGPRRSLPKSIAVALYSLVGLALLALVALLVRELMPHHATNIPSVAHHDDPVAAPAPTVAPAPAPTVAAQGQGNGHGHEQTDTPAPAAPRPDSFVRVRELASIIAHPESEPSTGVFHNRVTSIDSYSYDQSFGPYHRGSLKRDAKNPAAWELDGVNGPANPTKLEDIAPVSALHEAATVKDDQGNPVSTWFSIDSGPLAPAYATIMATGGTRVVSRAYLEENRTQFPPSLTAVLDR
jgi:hypothetical protein